MNHYQKSMTSEVKSNEIPTSRTMKLFGGGGAGPKSGMGEYEGIQRAGKKWAAFSLFLNYVHKKW